MRYESEILYDLMKRDGLLNPSQDSLPYESELKEKYVDEVKGAYPKVTDYRPEWLNYNLGYYIPADFPTESLVNVTTGTVNNVIPYAYKSAILKGNTLVNLVKNRSYVCVPNGGLRIDNIRENTKYLLRFNFTVKNASSTIIVQSYRDDSYIENTIVANNLDDKVALTFTTKPNVNSLRVLNPQNAETNITIDDIMLIEYQDGMENWDIPYFEGMKSVQMPVLTTSNEDGTKTNILSTSEDVELRGIGKVQDTLDCLTGEVVNNFSTYRFSDTDKWDTNTEMNSQRFTLKVLQPPVGAKYSNVLCIISDRLHGVKWEQSWNTVNTISCSDNVIAVHLPLGTTIEQCKELMRNSIAIYRTTKSIKTVDLTSVNQNGVPSTFRPIEGTMHVETDGEPLKPLLDMEIPVEATTQNLASFVNLEGVERTVNENKEIVGDENNEQLL